MCFALDKKVARLENLMLLLRFYTTQRSSVFYDLQFALAFLLHVCNTQRQQNTYSFSPTYIHLMSESCFHNTKWISFSQNSVIVVKGKKEKYLLYKIESNSEKKALKMLVYVNNIDRLDGGYVKNFDLWMTCTMEALLRIQHIIFSHLICEWINRCS